MQIWLYRFTLSINSTFIYRYLFCFLTYFLLVIKKVFCNEIILDKRKRKVRKRILCHWNITTFIFSIHEILRSLSRNYPTSCSSTQASADPETTKSTDWWHTFSVSIHFPWMLLIEKKNLKNVKYRHSNVFFFGCLKSNEGCEDCRKKKSADFFFLKRI